MRKKTVFVGGTSKVFSPANPLIYSSPLFYKSISSQDYEFVTKGQSDFLISFNHQPKLYRRFIKSGGSADRAVLIRLEPDSVFPAQYTKRITDLYGLVISPGSSATLPSNHHQIGWPYQYHLNPATPKSSDPELFAVLSAQDHADLFSIKNWEGRSHLLTMVAANKVSPTSKANYSLRRYLARSLPRDILEVYGPLWQDPIYLKSRHRLAVLVATLKQGSIPNLREIYGSLLNSFPSARGPIDNKHAILRDSKFSLIIENSNSTITEKVFDSIMNGAIPIYIGPNLETFGLPEGIAIQVRGLPQEILEVIQKFDSSDAARYLNRMFNFLRSASFLDNWEAGAVYRKIADEVLLYLKEFKE